MASDADEDASSLNAQHDVALYVAKVLGETREELARTDQKASILLAAVGVAAGAAAAAFVQIRFSPSALVDSVEWLWWVGLALVAVATAALGGAVMPSGRRSTTGLMHFFSDISRFPGTTAELLEAMAQDTARQPERDLSQLRVLARLVHRKYVLIRWAIWAAGSGLLVVLALLVFGG